MKTAIILYEPEQLTMLGTFLERFADASGQPQVISLDAEIDYALEKRGIPCISGAALQNREKAEAYLKADDVTRDLCENPALSFLSYRNISLLEPLRFSIHLYFIRLLTYVDIVARGVDSIQDVTRIVIPAPSAILFPTSGFLAEHELFAVVEAARRIAESRNIAFETVQSTPASLRLSNKWHAAFFMVKRALFGFGIACMGVLMSMRPRRPIRIIASDYWRNIAPVFAQMPDAELILIDRKEALKAGIKNVWAHNMRFMHLNQFVSWRDRRRALRYAADCLMKWKALSAEERYVPHAEFRGVSLAPVCERIMARLMERAISRVACDIAGTYAMYSRLSPDLVWLRVSVSTQIHFSILPLVARECDISSLEPQHGIDYGGEGSATRRHMAEYFALYGALVVREFETQGFAPERLMAVGSPRFDSYTTMPREYAPTSSVRVLTTIPNVNPFERFGTYSVEEHFAALGRAFAAMPSAELTVTSRNEQRAQFLHEAMHRGLKEFPYTFAGPAPLAGLFANADIFVCGYSTVVYESLMNGLPTVLVAFAPQETLMTEHSFAEFEKAGALIIARTPEALQAAFVRLNDKAERERLGEQGRAFMAEHFSFDGNASARIATFIKSHTR